MAQCGSDYLFCGVRRCRLLAQCDDAVRRYPNSGGDHHADYDGLQHQHHDRHNHVLKHDTNTSLHVDLFFMA